MTCAFSNNPTLNTVGMLLAAGLLHACSTKKSAVDPVPPAAPAPVVATPDSSLVAGANGLITANLPPCSASVSIDCIALAPFPAVDGKLLVAQNIANGITLAGITGTLQPPPACAKDGSDTCVVDGTKYKAASMAAAVATNIIAGATIAGVAGTAPVYANCATDGQVGCVAVTTFPAVAQTKLLPANIVSGATLAGVVGTRLAIQVCKSGLGFTTSNSTPYTDTTGFSTVDDYQNNNFPTVYTGSSRTTCNETNMANVTGLTTSLTPDTTKNASWTAIIQDKLTGAYWTNLLPTSNWTAAVGTCSNLSGGTGGTGWRPPTLKELLQFHVDGAGLISLINSNFGSAGSFVWSATSDSTNTANGWGVELGNGAIASTVKTVTTYYVICVRP